jgi:hypothetical protein
MTGKNEPFRSLGIRGSTSPALVDNDLVRWPLRSVPRDSVRSYGAAPIRSVASASINSCNATRTDRLADQVHAVTGTEHLEQLGQGRLLSSVRAWPYTPKIPPMAA